MMDIAEGIISGAAKEILGTYDVEWMGYKVNLAPGWKRMTMVQAVKEYVALTLTPFPMTPGPWPRQRPWG